MNKAMLRKWAEKQVPAFGKLRLDLKNEIWSECDEEGFIEAALDHELESGKDELLKKVERITKRIKKALDRPSPPGRSRHQESRPFLPLTREERMRAVVLSDYIAKHAATTKRVRRFRLAVMQGGVVSQEQAVAFINSPATYALERKHFAAYGIPLFDHRAQIVDETDFIGTPTIRAGRHYIMGVGLILTIHSSPALTEDNDLRW